MLNIIFITNYSAFEYSGGRYHGWMMTEALAAQGHRVTVWTSNTPYFINDFSSFPSHQAVKIVSKCDLGKVSRQPFDVVVLVPHLGKPHDIYIKALLLAQKDQARFILLNFESPNWFNKLSPKPRDPDLWRGWTAVSRGSDMILSSTRISTRYAKDYYTMAPVETLFRDCYPSINSIVADTINAPPKKKQIICITRLGEGHRHKGAHELIHAIGPAMKGYQLTIVVGTRLLEPDFNEKLNKKAAQFGVLIRFLHRLDDHQKFKEIKQSSLMLFLSHFEGFGYPPIEALYCDVPCIVSDLPVLREVCGEGLIYVKPGDLEKLGESVSKVLSGKYKPPVILSKHIRHVAKFENYQVRLNQLITELMNVKTQPNVLRKDIYSLTWDWYRHIDNDAKELAENLKESQIKLSTLTDDPVIKPVIKMRFGTTRLLKRCLPTKIFNSLFMSLHRKNME